MIQACVFVAREMRRSPYGPSPFTLEPTRPCADERCARGEFDRAFVDGDAAATKPYLDALVHRGDLDEASLAVAALGVRELGHLGHGAIMTAHALDMGALWTAQRATLLRAPIEYLTSFRNPDDSAARARAARDSKSDGIAAGLAARLGRGEAPTTVARALPAAAADLFIRARGDALFGPLHLVTSASAVRRVVTELARRSPRVAPLDAAEAVLRGATWLDMALAGATEIGPMEVRSSGEPQGQPARKATLEHLVKAMRAEEQDDVTSLTRALVQYEDETRHLLSFLVELAAATGRTTVQHSLKLLDATSQEHDAAHAGSPDRWVHLAANNRHALTTLPRIDPLYGEIARALGVKPHPQLAA